MPDLRSKLVTAAAIGAAAVGGGAIASAATSGSGSSSSSGTTTGRQAPPPRDRSQGGHTVDGKTEKLLTGDTKAQVQDAATAKVKGTVERVETNVDSSAPYEAHIRKSDGTEVEVTVSRDYKVVAVNEMGPGGPGGHP